EREQTDVPKAGTGEKAKHEMLDCWQAGEPAAESVQRERADGIHNPEQIENEEHAKGVVGDNSHASRCELRMIHIYELEPGQQRGVSAEIDQKPRRRRGLQNAPNLQLLFCHEVV